jgi:hypothetical protein
MSDQPIWISNEKSACIRKWTDHLHTEAKRLFTQDGTHGNMMFSFNKENGLISVNLIPPNIDHDQLNDGIMNAVNEYNLYGVVFIGETWMYFIKEKDHTAFQLLDGEMKVSDLNDEDKKEALMIRMENSDGDCLVYLNEIIRDENGHTLKEGKIIGNAQKKWFIDQNHRISF